eukprot:IDg6007t1
MKTNTEIKNDIAKAGIVTGVASVGLTAAGMNAASENSVREAGTSSSARMAETDAAKGTRAINDEKIQVEQTGTERDPIPLNGQGYQTEQQAASQEDQNLDREGY